MSYRPEHEWKTGARLPYVALSYCPHCKCVRAEKIPSGERSFIRRVPEPERVIDTEPPCVPAGAFYPPW